MRKRRLFVVNAVRSDIPTTHPPAIASRLAGLLPPESLLWQAEQTVPFECDGLAAFRQKPLAVALPQTEGEVREILRACHELKTPVVARGAGTGLSGGAMPCADGLLLSLAKLNRILSIDAKACIARVQPGVRNLAVSEAAAPYGLYYAPDPSSQIACSIGGNVAENSGGVHCLKYGLTVHNVLGVRGYLIDGTPVQFGGEALDSPGLDLLALCIGSEGLLTIVTDVFLKLVPKPNVAQVVMASFDDIAKAGDAVAAIIGAGIIPAGLEMMDKKATNAVEPFVNAGYDLSAEAILLSESDGTPEEVADEVAEMERVLKNAGATQCVVSQNETERLRFWSGRKNAFPAAGRISPDYYCMDGTIPRKNLSEMLVAIEAMEKKYSLRCMNVFHAGDGNLHPLILFDANRPGEWERADRFGADILELCVKLGGTITGEHGVGVEKINSMCVQFSDLERDAFLAVKRAFDDFGLLNPGKAIPTLHRCAEFGRMRVHNGEVPFADLPRF
jgi:glycolate oxidase